MAIQRGPVDGAITSPISAECVDIRELFYLIFYQGKVAKKRR